MGRSSQNSRLKFVILILFFALTWLLGSWLDIDVEYYKNLLARFPLIYAGTIFVLLYVVVSFFVWIAKDFFKIIGAVLFGAFISTIFIFIAEMVNAMILFNLSRFLGRDFVKDRIKGKWQSLDENIYRFGFFGIFVLRIVPLVPYRFLDIAAGLTRISFTQYLLAAILGSPIRIFWLQYILAVLGENVFKNPRLIADYFNSHPTVLILSFIYAIASFILSIFIKKVFKNTNDISR